MAMMMIAMDLSMKAVASVMMVKRVIWANAVADVLMAMIALRASTVPMGIVCRYVPVLIVPRTVPVIPTTGSVRTPAKGLNVRMENIAWMARAMVTEIAMRQDAPMARFVAKATVLGIPVPA